MAVGNYGTQIVLTHPNVSAELRKYSHLPGKYVFIHGAERADNGVDHSVSIHLDRDETRQLISDLQFAVDSWPVDNEL